MIIEASIRLKKHGLKSGVKPGKNITGVET
jgi:hypothetical protein